MNQRGLYTTHRRMKLIKAYFATKSAQRQCRIDFAWNKVDNRRKVERLMANFRENGEGKVSSN